MKLFFFLMLVSVSLFAQQPPEKQDLLSRADLFIGNFQYSEALTLMDQLGDTLDAGIMQRKGTCYFRLGNYPEAIRQFESIIKTDSSNRNALYQLAQVYGRNNQYHAAQACYQRLIFADSTNSYYYKQYASLAEQTNDMLTALANYFKAIRLNPKDVESQIMLGNLLLDMEQYETADTLMTRALQIHRSPQLRLLLAKAQFGEKKFEDVIRTVEQLMVNSDTIPAYARLLGISHFQLDHYDQVIPWMRALLNSGVEVEWIYYYMGASYQQLNQTDSAIVYLNKAIDKGISDNISNYYTQLAMAYESAKDLKSAIKYYKAAYESSKSDILLYHLARNYDVYYKDKSQAIAYYKRYLNSDDTIKIAREYTRYRLRELSDLR